MATTATSPATPLDLTGIGSTFANIPFRSKRHIYRMPKELVISHIPSTQTATTSVEPSPKKIDLLVLQPSTDQKSSKENRSGLEEQGYIKSKEKQAVFGVDLEGYAIVQTGESVYARFMRENGMAHITNSYDAWRKHSCSSDEPI